LLTNEAKAGSIPQELKDEAAALFRDVKSAPDLQEKSGWRARKAD
jgi:hypothetical protein